MNFKSFLGFGLLTALAVSCAVKEPAAPQEEQFPVLSAGFESVAPATRTSVTADKTIVWGEADEISVFYRTTANLRFALEGESGNSTANFKYADGFGSGVTIPYLCGFYPYAKELKLSADGVFSLAWPATQTYAKDGFGPGCNPMAAVSDNDRLYFKNLGGYLVLPLWGDKVAVESVTLKGNAGELLAGPAMAYVGPEMDPVAAIEDEGVEQIELVCTKPVMIGETEETATGFWFVLPPMVFEEGFTIVVKCNGGEELEFSADSPNEAYEIKRNSIYEMDPLCIKAASIDVTGVSVEPVKLGLEVGGTEQLTATVEPADATNQNVAWTSSDEEVATVDEEGVVTAVAEGEAVITATTEDGGFTAECTVVVAPVSVTGISLDPTELTLALKEEGTLTATVEPADAANKEVVWTSSDENVAQVEDGVVTAMGVGTATITATTVDGGLEAECTVTVYIPGRALPYEEPFDADLGETEIIDVENEEGFDVWTFDAKYGAVGTAFVDTDGDGKKEYNEVESHLVTPFLDLREESRAILSFRYAINHGDATNYANQFWLEIFDGASSTKVPVEGLPKKGSWTFYDGVADLTAFCGKTVRVEFVYNSIGLSNAAPQIEVDNIKVSNELLDPRLKVSETLSLQIGEDKSLDQTTKSNGQLTFTSSDPSIATVDEDGVVTGIATGSATITVSLAASGCYAGDEAECEVTVTESGTGVFTLFSGDLVEGDYVIYYDGNAMSNTVSSGRLDYKEVTPEDNAIANPDESIVWHIAKSGNFWTIYNVATKSYAASTGAKNKAGLQNNVNDKALWSASGSREYEFVNKQNKANGVNANLRYNDTYGFACYATNIGGALTLYKKK